MTLKIKPSKAAKKPVNNESGFTLSENFLIDQLETKKKTKHAEKPAAEQGKVGKMFKKKKTPVVEEDDDEEEPQTKKVNSKTKVPKQKKAMEEDDDFEIVKEDAQLPLKKSKPKKEQAAATGDGDVPGFSAPKVAKKRKLEGDKTEAKKVKKTEVKEQKPEVSKKELKIERKKKENSGRYDLSVKAKKVWEQLRREDTPKDKQLSLAAELYGMVKGHMQELVFAHDTVRVIECLFEKASQDIKDAVFTELKSHTVNLAKSEYAHHYLIKVLRHGNKEQRSYMIGALSGKVVKLMRHKFGAQVVEMAYNDWANAGQRAQLSQEFYGPEFKIFKDESVTTLSAALAKHPDKKEAFLKHMNASIEPIIAKGVFNHSLLHRLTNEYLTHCSPNERAEMIQSLRQAAVQILHTRDGARVAMTCIWHGTPKDRKDIIKSFKGHVVKICQEEHGHMVLMALFDTVDDTKLVAKAIVSEIATNWRDVVVHEHGRKVVMYLLAGRDPKYTHPQVISILAQGDSNTSSKKEMTLRHKELLQAASPAWLDAVTHEPEMWLKDNRNCLVLASVLQFCVGEGLLAAFQAVVGIVGEDLEQDTRNMFSSQGEKVQHWVEQPAVHMTLKKLIQFDKLRTEPPYFSQLLIDQVDPELVKEWLACNRGAFLLVNMMETDIDSVKKAVIEKVKPFRKFMQKQTNKGADILDSKICDF